MSATMLVPKRPPFLSPWLIVIVLAGFAAATCAGKDRALSAERKRHASAALRADSLEASRDTTRRVTLALGVLAADVQLLQRRSVQTEQRADSIDRALRSERKARGELELRVAPVRTSATAVARADSDGVHRSEFDLRAEPFTIHAAVAVPEVGRDSLRLHILLDSLSLKFRLHCSAATADGIRPASLAVFGPEWVHIAIARMEQSPDVCRSPGLEPRADSRSSWRKFVDRVGVNVGYGAVTDEIGRVHRGPGVMASYRLWP